MSAAFLRKFGTATTIYLPLLKRGVVDFALSADWTPVAGDVCISIDGAASANVTTLPTAIAMGNTAQWAFALSAGETTGKKISVTVADAATKAVEDQMFVIETYGNAAAEYQSDFSALAATLWDEVVDGSTTARQSQRLHNAVLGGKLSGGGTNTETIRDLADTKDRVVVSVDASGNRTSLTRDLS